MNCERHINKTLLTRKLYTTEFKVRQSHLAHVGRKSIIAFGTADLYPSGIERYLRDVWQFEVCQPLT